MGSREEWHAKLHIYTMNFRARRLSGEDFYRSLQELAEFSFWQRQLDSSSTWVTKHKEHIPIAELDNDHLVNIWNYMLREQEFMSLIWVVRQPDPAAAHIALEDDWYITTPLMEALFWEATARGLQVEEPQALVYPDVDEEPPF